MAAETPVQLRNQTIYSIFVRNYSPEGTFEGVRRDLDRIRSLGVDIIWLMPVHPTGEVHRKGSLGSPYAIRNYREINPEYGTMDDFIRLVDEIHAKGMKCIIDVVYNHTSPDSWLAEHHPEWFYHRKDGSFGNRIGDWWDVIDLDYTQKDLWDYQIDTLKFWAQYVDGFRCDVAPLVPVDFWKRARKEVAEVRRNCLWLAESVDPRFILEARMHGMNCASDSELYEAFDICYDYDIYELFFGALAGKNTLADYADALNRQEYTYPGNYVKLRFLENHDRVRAAFLFRDEKTLRSWTAFCAFQKGTFLVYAGEEQAVTHKPTLFDRDTIAWDAPGNRDLSGLIRKLTEIRRDPLFADSSYHVSVKGDVIFAVHTADASDPADKTDERIAGIFPVKGRPAVISVQGEIPDGIYENLIDGSNIEVEDMGRLSLDGSPVIFRYRDAG